MSKPILAGSTLLVIVLPSGLVFGLPLWPGVAPAPVWATGRRQKGECSQNQQESSISPEK